MIIFTDKTLADAGLDFDVARALLAPADGELLVHVTQVLDGPPVPPLDLGADEDPVDAPRTPALPQAYRQGQQQSVAIHGPVEGETAFSSLVVDSPPTDLGSVAARLHAGQVREVGGGGPEVRQRPEGHDPQPAVNRLGIPRLPERAFTLADVIRVAHALRCTVQTEPSSPKVMLTGTFGCRVYPSLAEAADALNKRSYCT